MKNIHKTLLVCLVAALTLPSTSGLLLNIVGSTEKRPPFWFEGR